MPQKVVPVGAGARKKSLFSGFRYSATLKRVNVLESGHVEEPSFFARAKESAAAVFYQSPGFISAAGLGVVVGVVGAAAERQREAPTSIPAAGALIFLGFTELSFAILLKFSALERTISSCTPVAIALLVVWGFGHFPLDLLSRYVLTNKDLGWFGSYVLASLLDSGIICLYYSLLVGLNLYFSAQHGSLVKSFPTPWVLLQWTIMHALLFATLFLLQLLFLSKLLADEESQIEQFLIVCIAFPLYSALGFRIFVADYVSWLSIRLFTSSPDDDWKTTEMLLVRGNFITTSKCIVAVHGVLALLSIGNNLSFALGLGFSAVAELFAVFAQYFLSKARKRKSIACKPTKEENEQLVPYQEFKEAVFKEEPTFASFVKISLKIWATDFVKPHYRRKSFALSAMIENRCEKHVILACGAFLAYGRPEKAGQVMIRAFTMFFAEVCLVDAMKSKLLKELFGIYPFESKTRITFVEICNLLGWIAAVLILCSFAKQFLSELGIKIVI